jgi:putative lipoic acid-binding regulatory protein
VTSQGKEQKVKIDYPTDWKYKLIALEKKHIQDVVKDALDDDKKHKLEISNKSKTGKFISMTLSLQVVSEEERIYLFKKFESSEHIKYVL